MTNKKRRLLILGPYSSDLDFDYFSWLKEIRLQKDYEIFLVVGPEYEGTLTSLELSMNYFFPRSRFDWATIRKLMLLCTTHQIDLVFCGNNKWLSNAFFALLFSRNQATKLIVRRGISERLRPWRLEDLISYYNSRLSYVVCLSKAVQDELLKSLFFNKKNGVCYPCLDIVRTSIQSLDMNRVIKKFDPNFDGITILTIANSRYIKGIDRAIDAARLLAIRNHRFRWIIVGNGTDQESILNKYKSVPKQILGLGYVGNAEILLDLTDIYVQPSRNEGLGLAAVNAAMHGIPCIFTKVGGLVEILPNEFDAFVDNIDDVYPNELCLKLEALIASPELRRKWGERCSEFSRSKFQDSGCLASTITKIIN